MKSTLLHALLALVGLCVAYQTWTRVEEDETPVGEALLAECDANTLKKLTLVADKLKVTLEPERKGDRVDYWMTVERAAKDTADGDAADSSGNSAPQAKRFLTNKKVDEFLKLIYPLRARRHLGTPSEGELKGFGMDKVSTTLTLECGASTTLELGGSTFGNGDLYGRRKGDTSLVLLDGRLSKDLQSAEFNFMQKALHGFVLKHVDEARVSVNGASKRLLQRNRQTPDQAAWVDAARPDQRNELYDNWLTRLSRMTVREYLATNAVPGSELSPAQTQIKEIAVVEYFLDGVHQDKLTLVRAGDDMTHYYARSESTRNWVSVSEIVAQQIERDAAAVVGLEEPAAPVAPIAPPTTPAH